MAVDYDLIILGGTPEGYEAAEQAAQLGARVAWILNGQEGRRSPLFLETLLLSNPQSEPSASQSSQWQRAVERAKLTADVLTQEDLQRLMVQGVDVIAETGRLVRDRPLQVKTVSRQLTARSVLLATGNVPQLFKIPGLASVPYETPSTFLHQEKLPGSVIVLGRSPAGLALCQFLRRWNSAVTLVAPQDTLLPREDPDTSRWIQAQLRAEGVRLKLGTIIETVTYRDGSICLRLPHETISVACLVVAAPPLPNLMDVGIEKWTVEGCLSVNAYLQTSHPRIYACGAAIGGHELAAIARQEARLAVSNALFWNRYRIDYCTIPYTLLTRPEMARVGLTEAQAKRRYSEDDLLIARQTLYDLPKAQWRRATLGFCKVIAHRSGEILGVHGVGPEAREWVQTMAVLMVRQAPWWAVAHYPTLPNSLTDILRQTVSQWERDRWHPGRWRRDWSENWFNWRRQR
ncbi:NAD(P)/FAD-dependent oxidoreductase [Oscillatoria sp. CS-180]|uniref:FAD-dependent oxidoreductase n=1 Tax=Oscillatoria sp. CS-180 TaxID=3021720 RepID=UPI00232F53BA|nr:NAD(P)/FAD-dependent oxidoreductase [Oscillatoria sp. CS-180]MDB9524883.1 NAD(P)/FAD-dependent oxidoreductase [Oscillatoria sp. CS-180]